MARAMIGAEELAAQPSRIGKFGEHRIEVRGLRVSDDAGQPAVRDFSLAVRRGEIVGIAGVSGNGQHELVEALAGQREPDSGEIRIGGDPFHATRAEMHRHKISCLPDEPLRNACVGKMSVAENMAFRGFDRPPFAIGGGWLRPSKMRAEAKRRIAQYRIRTRSLDMPLADLSGGNVQRVVLARELEGGAEVMIAANPCFGLDFSAVAQIRAEIMAARNRGAAVLLVSSDLDEILELADRLVVIFNGQVVHEARVAEADLTEIGRQMAGH
jgi:simple sugar transport system ATP-binding protein